MSIIEAAARQTAVDLKDAFAETVARHLTCSEVESLATLYRALGMQTEADDIIVGHAEADDDPEDLHYASWRDRT